MSQVTHRSLNLHPYTYPRETHTCACGYGYRQVWVWVQEGHMGMVTCMGWHCGFASISSPYCYCFSLSPPCEQLLTAVVVGATVVVVTAVGGGTWLVAPSPQCERVLTVVEDRCWSAVSLLPHTLAEEPHDPPYKQVLVGMGWVHPLSL